MPMFDPAAEAAADHPRVRVLLVGLGLLACAQPLWGQRGKSDDPRVDPYTKNEPHAMAQAGYVAWGDLLFCGTRTKTVQEALGEMPLVWVETEHFRIGAEFPECAKPTLKEEKRRFEDELRRLSKKLPSLKPRRLKRLDPWLRLHLLAQRAEDSYAEFETLLGVDEKPLEGPHLGRKEKFHILVVDKRNTLARYTGRFCGFESSWATSHYFDKDDAMLFAIATEPYDSSDQPDTEFFAAFKGGLFEAMLDGFGRPYQVPFWFRQGMKLQTARGVFEKFDQFGGITGHVRFERWHDWEVRAFVHIREDLFRHFPDQMSMGWDDERIDIVDHILMWSLCRFLLEVHSGSLRAFVDACKEPVQFVDQESYLRGLKARQTEALHSAFGLTPEELDQAHIAWVLKNEPRGL